MEELISAKDKILEQINLVREPLHQIYVCSEQIKELFEKKHRIEKLRKKQEKTSAAIVPILFFVCWLFLPGLSYMIGSINLYKFLINVTVAAGFSLCILFMTNSSKKYTIKKYISQEKELEEQIFELENKRTLLGDSIAGSVRVIPPDYQYFLATEYIYSCILNQRAATIGEAVNLYEDQLHKWKMEQMQSKLLEIGVQQQYTLNKIRKADTVAAAANVATAVFNGMRV